jgi:hypothetical protein
MHHPGIPRPDATRAIKDDGLCRIYIMRFQEFFQSGPVKGPALPASRKFRPRDMDCAGDMAHYPLHFGAAIYKDKEPVF